MKKRYVVKHTYFDVINPKEKGTRKTVMLMPCQRCKSKKLSVICSYNPFGYSVKIICNKCKLSGRGGPGFSDRPNTDEILNDLVKGWHRKCNLSIKDLQKCTGCEHFKDDWCEKFRTKIKDNERLGPCVFYFGGRK